MGHGINFFDQNCALGTVAEIELHHGLLLARDVGGLGRGIHDMIAVAGQFLDGVSACFQPIDGKAAARAGLVCADDGPAAAAGTGHITDLEDSALDRRSGHGIIFPDHQGRERGVLENHPLRFIPVNDDRLSERFFELESVCRFHLGDGKLAGVQPLAQLMDLDLASGICEHFSVVDGGRGLRRLAVAGIGNVEFGVLNGLPGDGIFLKNGQFRGFSVPEGERLFVIGAEGDGLSSVSVFVREVVGRRDGLLRYLVNAGGHDLGHLAVRAGSPVVLIGAVQGLDREHRIGDRGPAVRIDLREGEQRFFIVAQPQF